MKDRGGRNEGAVRGTRPLASVLGLVLVAALVYALVPCGRDTIDTVASRSGVLGKVVPWTNRAETALRRMMDGPSGGAAAQSIQRITHPTGLNARLQEYAVRRVGDAISVRISTSWQGGFVGTNYTIVVVWEFNEARHVSTAILSDDALAGVTRAEARALDDYFRLELYPVLCSNVGS